MSAARDLAHVIRKGAESEDDPRGLVRFIFGKVTTVAANNLRVRPDGMPSGDVGPVYNVSIDTLVVDDRVLLGFVPGPKLWLVIGVLRPGTLLATLRAAGDTTALRLTSLGGNNTKTFLGLGASTTSDPARIGAYLRTDAGSIIVFEVANAAGTFVEMMSISRFSGDSIGFNDFPLRLRGQSDANHYVQYNATRDGPRLSGWGGAEVYSAQRAAVHFAVEGQAPPANSDTCLGVLVYKDSAGAIKSNRVTVGAAGSGGAGFRVLRVPD